MEIYYRDSDSGIAYLIHDFRQLHGYIDISVTLGLRVSFLTQL